MRLAVALFFVVCAIFLFVLTLRSELANERRPPKASSGVRHIPTRRSLK
jgi:hypothetical protein